MTQEIPRFGAPMREEKSRRPARMRSAEDQLLGEEDVWKAAKTLGLRVSIVAAPVIFVFAVNFLVPIVPGGETGRSSQQAKQHQFQKGPAATARINQKRKRRRQSSPVRHDSHGGGFIPNG